MKKTLKEYQNTPQHRRVDKREAKEHHETLKQWKGSKKDNEIDKKRLERINKGKKKCH